MTGRLQNKRIIVTGGAKGIGRAIVARFIEEGASVLLTDIDEAVGRDVAKELGAVFYRQDVGDEAGWSDLMRTVQEKFGGLDVLVNNAGIGEITDGNSPEDTKLDDWQRTFRVNTEGVFLGCRAAIPLMVEAGGGSIINLSSIAALVPTPFITAYGASKAAVLQLSKSVALQCAQQGHKIRCNTIHPGQISTPMHDGLIRDAALAAGAPVEAVRADFLSRIPLGEFGETVDIANAALFLASEEAHHITGEQMIVDGGMKLIN